MRGHKTGGLRDRGVAARVRHDHKCNISCFLRSGVGSPSKGSSLDMSPILKAVISLMITVPPLSADVMAMVPPLTAFFKPVHISL